MTEETGMEKPSYYAIITADVRYDERLSPSEKLMWGELTCLTNKFGFSTASNNYFAKLYNKDPSTISKWVKHLEECGYITVDYERNGKQIISRIIRMTHGASIEKLHNSIENFQGGVLKKSQEGIEKISKRIIQEYNNTSNNIYRGIEKQRVFKKPTVEEIKAYCLERGNNVDAEYFYDYYESKGWTVGKGKMKDWKASVRTWERNDYSSGRVQSTGTFKHTDLDAIYNKTLSEEECRLLDEKVALGEIPF